MTEFIDQIDEYKKQGLGEDYIQRRIKQKQNYLLQQGYSVDQVQDELGVSLSRKEIDPEISKPIESF